MKVISLHRSKATFRHYQKQFRNYPAHLQEQLLATTVPFRAHQAGQDRIIEAEGLGEHPQNRLLMVSDGHGPNGHHVSYVGGQLLFQNLVRITPIIVGHLRDGHQEKIPSLLTWAYRHTEKQMYQTDSHRNRVFSRVTGNSGCTVSAALVLHVSGQRYLISSNAGDSPIYLHTQADGVTECGREHNCDCQEAVTDYLRHLQKVRQQLESERHTLSPEQQHAKGRRYQWRLQALKPKTIYWNRINTGTLGSLSVPQIADSTGQPIPLPTWKYLENHDGTPSATVDLDSYERISEFYPVGGQSLKLPPTRVREDGRTVAVEGREADNFGSTLAGRVQVLRGLGDEYEGEHVTCEPFVSIRTVPGPATLLLASDGLTDLEYEGPLMDQIDSCRDGQDPGTDVYQYLQELASKDTSGQYTVRNIQEGSETKWHPNWDDLSGQVVYFT